MITEELKSIFESVDKELLSEDTLNAISTLIESKIDSTVQARLDLEVESAVKAQYDKFKIVSEKAVAAIDKDHTAKIKFVHKAITEDFNQKLLAIHEGYKKLITETAKKDRDTLVESVDEFLDLYISKHISKNQIEEAARNKYATKAIEEARKVLGVDERFISENIKEALIDGKRQLDSLLKENTQFKKNQMIRESKNVLAEKLANLPVDQAKFVRSRLEGKSAEFIKENFNYVVDMYNRNSKKERNNALINENKNFNVDRNRVADEILKESENKPSVTTNPINPMEDLYLKGLNFRK